MNRRDVLMLVSIVIFSYAALILLNHTWLFGPLIPDQGLSPLEISLLSYSGTALVYVIFLGIFSMLAYFVYILGRAIKNLLTFRAPDSNNIKLLRTLGVRINRTTPWLFGDAGEEIPFVINRLTGVFSIPSNFFLATSMLVDKHYNSFRARLILQELHGRRADSAGNAYRVIMLVRDTTGQFAILFLPPEHADSSIEEMQKWVVRSEQHPDFRMVSS